ncbi:hypothetical protein BLNAU_6333 [Blattamonas nauphoetae]|uniref:Uncharacterized protein n=1 Tax=Blattamonas nauphoetae TaxID=2049346 RepID=A0ABQ9Y4C8_9EUKA|nr:hypothetical protein BLNAU_6333 [Blattamonas nauphoetae]
MQLWVLVATGRELWPSSSQFIPPSHPTTSILKCQSPKQLLLHKYVLVSDKLRQKQRQRSEQKTSKARKSHVFPTIPPSDNTCLDFSLQPLQRTKFPSDVMKERS